ncbi:MAG TPA: hypothetical protein PLM53_08745 [Spirochaetota bacterium]|nr:hypothetical protein [Spirochaetota bacterium]HPC42218.1 hypothetical protein [Spirochaetota bacterium]HQH97173.1 hypothetical protein [Spirochaetota bacterium]HQJ70083.1 hypothetical protein [Spirochaetota bacterium]HRS76791.1 hypothetical protein [Spirochaetota bacterium]
MDSAKVNYRLIRDAYRSLDRKKFQEAILVLEKVLSSGAGDIYVLLLLSVAYLHTDQFGKLARFITKMREMNRSYMPLIQLEAFLKLKSAASKEEALKVYIDLMAKYPADPHIHRGRGLVSGAADFRDFQKNARLQDFVSIPAPPRSLKKTAIKSVYTGMLDRRGVRIIRDRHFPWRRIGLVMLATALAVSLVMFGVWLFTGPGFLAGAVRRAGLSRADYSGIDRVTLGGTEYDLVKNMAPERVPVYYQSVRDMTADFNRARTLIKAGQHNDAILLLNDLYNSNVNFVVKEKVAFLIKFVTDLEDRDYSEVPYANVEKNRYRYRGFAVRWKGRIGKIKQRGGSQVFTMSIDAPGDKSGGAADVYSPGVMPGLSDGTRVQLDGVIMDFIGKEKRAYVMSRNIRILK